MKETLPYRSIAVTGASGYIGEQLIRALADDRRGIETIVACDIRLPAREQRIAGVEYVRADVCRDDFGELLGRHRCDLVVHLAAIVNPGRGMSRELEYEVDVTGTANVLYGCIAAGVRKIIYTSSGAAYGYHADNPQVLREEDPLRGNEEFGYSHHKRLVEEMLAKWRSGHPGLLQLVLRPGTILGATVHNQITDLFDAAFVIGVRGAQTPFVLVWDVDVVGAILHGIHEGGTGIYNLAGDGTLGMAEIASLLKKRYVPFPPALIREGLRVLHAVGLSRYGPEQVGFLRYRPVLDNRRLKEEFGYVPRKTTREVFDLFVEARAHAA
ncbi:MAG TPA: SDR family oxidoreductase [Candidatus Binatia bacterium]|jgi:UDP-glucose 4-epimerase